ncbi:hypothetical protein BDV06DRAFT_194649, partial [Aspergillus oleicola]
MVKAVCSVCGRGRGPRGFSTNRIPLGEGSLCLPWALEPSCSALCLLTAIGIELPPRFAFAADVMAACLRAATRGIRELMESLSSLSD